MFKQLKLIDFTTKKDDRPAPRQVPKLLFPNSI